MKRQRKQPDNAAAVGEEIRRLRRWLNITQAELSQRAGVSQMSVSRVEIGRTTTPGIVEPIINALRVAQAQPRKRGR